MIYKLGKYYLDTENVDKFIKEIIKILNINKPNIYYLHTPYTNEFYKSYNQYVDNYFKEICKLDSKPKYNPPVIELEYLDNNNQIQIYNLCNDNDIFFLGIFNINTEDIYINLGCIFTTLAHNRLHAKRKGVKSYKLTKSQLSATIKDTIIHELYHLYQKRNNLEYDCDKCTNFANDVLRGNRFLLKIDILEEGDI